MSKRKHFLTTNKLMGFYGFAIIGLFLFEAGVDSTRHHWFQVALDVLIALFGLGFVFIMWMESIDNAERNMRDWYVEDAKHQLDKIFEQAKEFADRGPKLAPGLQEEIEHDTELASAIAKDILQGEKRTITPEEATRIEQAFHDQSDGKYLKIHNSSDDGFEMEISGEPIEHVPGHSQAHEEARVRGDKARATKIPVRDGDEPAKPLTKSQQRRLNVKKGLGPLTDDEVREQKNAKRREARAAKKAASDTTTTTTQPGQTSLV